MSQPCTVAHAEPPTQPSEPQPPIIIEKLPPRPAPTMAYSYKEYNSNTKVIYVQNHKEANEVLANLHPPTGPLGFDLEWRPNFFKGGTDNPVALVQLANESVVMLFQVSAMEAFPSKLIDVLQNADIVKAGVAIQGDAKKLFNDYNVPVRNCVDLTLLARTVDNARWAGRYNSPIGLAHMIQSYEYRLLPKGRISRSNWEAVLDAKQLEYASNDAHAGYILYKRLEAMIPSMPSPPDTTWYSFSIFDGNLCDDQGALWQAKNPNYDPGPLPPPKEPTEAQLANKERRKQKLEELAKRASSGSSPQGNVATPVQPQHVSGPSFPPRRGVHQPRFGRMNLVAASLQHRPASVPSTSQRVFSSPSQRLGNSPSRGRGFSSHANGRKTSVPPLFHQHQPNGWRGFGRGSGRDTEFSATNPTTSHNRSNGRRPQRPQRRLPTPNRSTMMNAPASSTSIVPSSPS